MKKQVVPVLILIFLIVLYFAVQHKESSSVGPKNQEDVVKIDTSAVNKITMRRLGSSVTLSRAAGVWYVNEGDDAYRADQNAVDRIVGTLADLQVGNVISENPENQMKFQVDTLTGSTVELFSGDKLLTGLVVGKMSGDFGHTYVRPRGSDNVYLAAGMLTHLFTRSADAWRDHNVINLDKNEVSTIEINSVDEVFRIVRSDSLWKLSTPPFDELDDGDQDNIDRVVETLCNLDASGFATPKDSTEYDFSDVQSTWTITLSNGSSTVLEAADVLEDSDRHFVRVLGDKTVYILPENVWNQITKSYDDLLPGEKNS